MDCLELLYQDEIWVDGQNWIYWIVEMNIWYVQNIYWYLIGYLMVKSYLDLLFFLYMLGLGFSGDVVIDVYEGEMVRLEEVMWNLVVWVKELFLMEVFQERGWGCFVFEVKKFSYWEILVLVKVKIGYDVDVNFVEYDIEEVLKNLFYDIEVVDFW